MYRIFTYIRVDVVIEYLIPDVTEYTTANVLYIRTHCAKNHR